jgi:putative Holliday junction resolvase
MPDNRSRVLGIDVGRRRVGLAISDVTQTIARPLDTLTVNGLHDAVESVAVAVERLAGEEDGLGLLIVGVPVRLDGSSTDQTAHVASFMDALATRTRLPVVGVDERLTSREAESRLAVRERDWRRRKAKLDAAAAAVILQDYLDRTPRT